MLLQFSCYLLSYDHEVFLIFKVVLIINELKSGKIA